MHSQKSSSMFSPIYNAKVSFKVANNYNRTNWFSNLMSRDVVVFSIAPRFGWWFPFIRFATFDNSACNLTHGERPKFIRILSRQVLIAMRRMMDRVAAQHNTLMDCRQFRTTHSRRHRRINACVTFPAKFFALFVFAGREERRITVGIWLGFWYLWTGGLHHQPTLRTTRGWHN